MDVVSFICMWTHPVFQAPFVEDAIFLQHLYSYDAFITKRGMEFHIEYKCLKLIESGPWEIVSLILLSTDML